MTNRFLGLTDIERDQMLGALGFGSLDDLFSAVVPPEHQYSGKMTELGDAKSELEVRLHLAEIAFQNRNVEPQAIFIGGGHYQREIPSANQMIAGRGEWMTPYTPYQAEAAQGILATLIDYQSLVKEMTGMKIANAGLYHGANSLVEATFMACRITGRNKVLYSEGLHPTAIANLQTAFNPKIYSQEFELASIPSTNGITLSKTIEELVDDKTAAVIVQNPNFFGLLDGMDDHADAIHEKGALYISYGGGDQISLALIKPPGEFGAAIYAGEGQHFGIPVGYGGPHIGMLAMSASLDDSGGKNIRQLPGRLILQAEDMNGKRAFRLGLQTREQHIRRERATSNTCTAETLIAVMSTIWFAIKGEAGVREAASQSYHIAHYLEGEISKLPGYNLLYGGNFFNEFVVQAPQPASKIVNALSGRGIFAGVPLEERFPNSGFEENSILMAATEMNNSKAHIGKLLEGLAYYGTAN